jgi:aldehyde:ferredoxin oxidoreductase
MKGVFQKALVIDLTEQSFREEIIPAEVYEHYLGGKGLGTYLLLKHNKPKVDPFSPDNTFILTLGPITDTKIWGSSRYGVYTKAPLTGLYSEAYSGGKVAEPMSRTGYDAFILKGASTQPVFLEISDEGVTFHDASSLWGMDAYKAEDAIQEKVGGKDTGVLVIGPAGEKLVRFAALINNYWRCAGRTGVGAVLGSKKVKGLAFHGTKSREPAHPELIEKLHHEWLGKSKELPAANFFKNFGTPGLVSIINNLEAFPTRYWSEGVMEGWQAISAETLHAEFSVKPRACNRCFMACGRYTTVIKEGRFKGLTLEGPEYETIYAFGGLCLINKLEDIIHLNDVCDKLGMDTITAGNLAAFAIEASKRGKIKEKLDYGDTDAIADLFHKIASREGIGTILAEGIKSAAKAWGLEDIAIHVKGMEPAGYDPRYFKGMGLAYATSDRGACHMRTTFFRAELVGIIPPDQIEGKAEVLIEFEDRLTLHDALILCRFYRDIYLWDELAEIIHATTGMEVDKPRIQRIASNIKNAVRVFNMREGMTAAEDTLPRRFFEEPIGSKQLVIKRAEFEQMKADYYRLRGWDEAGVPKGPLPLNI